MRTNANQMQQSNLHVCSELYVSFSILIWGGGGGIVSGTITTSASGSLGGIDTDEVIPVGQQVVGEDEEHDKACEKNE